MLKKIILSFLLLIHFLQGHAQEKIFADYFDIRTNSPEFTSVTGGIHIESNKDILFKKVPSTYHFEIIEQEDSLFGIKTIFEQTGRIVGKLYVNKGENTGENKSIRQLTIALINRKTKLNEFNVKIHIVEKTLWETFFERYFTYASKTSRLYGRKKLKDKAVTQAIHEIDRNEGRLQGFHCYNETPETYKKKFNKTIDLEWEAIADQLGQLGYAYCMSKTYGPKGDKIKHNILKEVLKKAIMTYISCVPIEGKDVIINGRPIGKYTGDGTSLLPQYNLAINNYMEHHWRFTDALILPIMALMPDIVEGIELQDPEYINLHQALIRYFQLFTAIVKERRSIYNNPRWGELTDTNYSGGAWADANLGHRSRTMLALPIIWADYNRPMTYVQYWYSDFYKNKPYKGFSFSPGWSPCGVVKDVSRWMTKFNVPSHHYGQSGFHPDGTISHHIGHGTDAAMVAYGFEWLTDCSFGFQYFKDTDYEIDSPYYQFQLDRLLNVYPKLFYKNRMDFLISGRSYLEDLHKFVVKTYYSAIKELDKAKSKRTQLVGMDSLKNIGKRIKENSFEYSGTTAYWVNEFLVHRRGEHEFPFYASVKLKSERTVGIEDFSKIRKSWHGGYGILQVKVNGDEYDEQVLANCDWHALPGLTEEWRTDPFPTEGGSQASLPGRNKIAGVLSDGQHGMAIYHHLPSEAYSSASAYKSYFFINDRIICLGNNILRTRKGQQRPITTFIDQTEFYDRITWRVNGKEGMIRPDESVRMEFLTDKVCWFHMGKKGYIIVPKSKTSLMITTGTEINITDKGIANKKPNFILSINHGIKPDDKNDNYAFIEIPNTTSLEMSEIMKDVQDDLDLYYSNEVHTVFSHKEKLHQFAFFKPSIATAGNITMTSEDTAMVMLQEREKEWLFSVGSPSPNGKKRTLKFITNANLHKGTYKYMVSGVHPLEGETIEIKDRDGLTEITVNIPDITNEKQYNYQSDLYAATPIVIRIAK